MNEDRCYYCKEKEVPCGPFEAKKSCEQCKSHVGIILIEKEEYYICKHFKFKELSDGYITAFRETSPCEYHEFKNVFDDTINMKHYETMPIEVDAIEITDEKKIVQITGLKWIWGRITFSAIEEPNVGGFIIRLAKDDIYYCTRENFIKKYKEQV